MARFLWNWTRCWARAAGSSCVQYEWPASVVGTIDASSAAAASRGNRPSASAVPATTIAAALARTSSSSSSGSGATRRIDASSGPAVPTRPPGVRNASAPSRA